MFHSFLLIDTGNDPHRPRPGRRLVHNPYRVHQRLCMGFPRPETRKRTRTFSHRSCRHIFPRQWKPGAKTHVHEQRDQTAGFLFRIDPLPASVPSRHAIIVQSAIEPDWEYAFHNATEFLCTRPLVRPFNPRSKRVQASLRLRANPTKKVGSRCGKNAWPGRKQTASGSPSCAKPSKSPGCCTRARRAASASPVNGCKRTTAGKCRTFALTSFPRAGCAAARTGTPTAVSTPSVSRGCSK